MSDDVRTSGNESASRGALKFAEEFVAPIHKGEKTATLRYDLERRVEVGDELDAILPDGSGFATIEVKRRATCMAVETKSVLDVFGAEYPAEDEQDVIDSLNQHYDSRIDPGTMVEVIVFEVLPY